LVKSLKRNKRMLINEFTNLGTIIFRLRDHKEASVTQEMMEEFEQDMERMGQSMLIVWSENRNELKYYLDFHYMEAQRLLDMLIELQANFSVRTLPYLAEVEYMCFCGAAIRSMDKVITVLKEMIDLEDFK